MKLRNALLAVLVMLLPSFANSAVPVTAQEMAACLPDKVLTFSSTKPPTLQDETKEQVGFHRVQKLYDADNRQKMAAVAIISGAGVAAKIAGQFSAGKPADVHGFRAALQTSTNPPPSVSMSVKLADDEMITVMVLNSRDVSDAKKFVSALDLKCLAGASAKRQ
jgi:hypothetical protein